MNRKKRAILFFVRRPEPGRVKTRLAAGVGPEAAARLYDAFARDMYAHLSTLGEEIIACFEPTGFAAEIESWLPGAGGYLPQHGRGLGERMANAFEDAFKRGAQAAVLVGSDLPDLPAELAAQGLDLLAGNPSVVGPAADGGYYLIGFTRRGYSREVLTSVGYGRDDVFRATLEALAGAGAPPAVIAPWGDVDTQEELRELAARLSGGGPACAATRQALDDLLAGEGE